MVFLILEYCINFLKSIIRFIQTRILYNFKSNNLQNCNKILEFPKDYNIKDDLMIVDQEEILYQELFRFLKENSFFEKGIIISLSGGVDSMVILGLLIEIRKYKFFKIYAVMINYNLRDESIDESRFIEKFCQNNNIEIEVTHIENFPKDRKNVGSSKRKEYEDFSKDMRFNSYKNIIDKKSAEAVILGHHKDDIIENIFTNLLKGHNLLDIEVMKSRCIIKGVLLFRPLLDFNKSDIYDFAHKYNIPYFKDTTPSWSRRGQMRKIIFPLLSKVFGSSWKVKLKEIGNQSNLLFDTVNNNLINPWINEVKFENLSSNKNFVFELPIKHKEDLCLWYYIIPKLFYRKGYQSIKKKSIEKIFGIANNEKNDPEKLYILDKGFTVSKIDEKLFVFHDNSSLKDILLYGK